MIRIPSAFLWQLLYRVYRGFGPRMPIFPCMGCLVFGLSTSWWPLLICFRKYVFNPFHVVPALCQHGPKSWWAFARKLEISDSESHSTFRVDEAHHEFIESAKTISCKFNRCTLGVNMVNYQGIYVANKGHSYTHVYPIGLHTWRRSFSRCVNTDCAHICFRLAILRVK